MKAHLKTHYLTLSIIPAVVLVFAFSSGFDSTKASGSQLSKVTKYDRLSQPVLQQLKKADLQLSIPRRNHTATSLKDGRLLFIGGENADGEIRKAEVLDAQTGTVASAGSVRFGRANHSATLLDDGRVLIVGGTRRGAELTSTEIFDPVSGAFSKGPDLIKARAAHSATRLSDGKILVLGGRLDRTAEIYDPATSTFTLLKSQTNALRVGHSAVSLSDGKVFIAGSTDFYDGDTAETFDPIAGSFTPTKNWMQVNRVRPELRVLPDGKIQVIAGDSRGSIEIFEPRIRRFRNLAGISSTSNTLDGPQMLRARTRIALISASMSAASANGKKSNVSKTSDNNSLTRAGYSYSEIEYLNLAVIAGGTNPDGEYLRSVVLVESSPSTVTTDQVEYLQSATPQIKGAGWTAGEEVAIIRQNTSTGERTRLTSFASGAGEFSNGDLNPEHNQVGVYVVTAIGLSSNYVAQTSYRIANAPKPDAERRFNKPVRIKAMIPVGRNQGTIETDLGTMRYETTPADGVKLTPAKGSGANLKKEPLGRSNVTFDLVSFNLPWSGLSFPIPFSPVTIDSSSGSLSGRAFIELKAEFDEGGFECCAEILGECVFVCPVLPSASAEAALVGEFDLRTVTDFSYQGDFAKNDILVLPIAAVKADIPNTPFKVDLQVGLMAGVQLTADRRVKFHTTLDVLGSQIRAGVGASFGIELVPPDLDASLGPFFRAEPPTSITGSAQLVEFGGACARLSLGPGISGSIELIDIDICSLDLDAFVRLAPFVKACAVPTTDTETCQIFSIDINVGIQADVEGGFGCGVLSFGFDESFDLLDINVASFGRIVFKDTAPPTITCPADIVVSTDPGKCTAIVSFPTPVASACGGITSIVSTPPSGSVFQKGTTTVTSVATAENGQTVSCTFTVTVNDTEKPVLTACPPNVIRFTEPGKCSAVVTYVAPTATDNCPGLVTTTNPPSGTAFPKGVNTVTAIATDASGNQTTCSFTVTIIDNEKPTIVCPKNVLTNTTVPGSSSVVVNYDAPVIADNCPGSTVVCTPPSGAVFPVGDTMVTCVVTDAAGNSASCSFTVTVFDAWVVDDATGVIARMNTANGYYELLDCRKRLVYSGFGTVTKDFCKIELRHSGPDAKKPDRSVYFIVNRCTNVSTGTVHMFAPGTKYALNDPDLRNSRIICP